MPTVQELINRTEYLVDDDMSPEICVMLFNMCQEDLAEVAGYTKVAETNFYKGAESVTLPSDLVDIEEVYERKENENEYTRRLQNALVHKYAKIANEDKLSHYELVGDTLYLKPNTPYEGYLRIKYYSMLPEIPLDLNYTPKLKRQFHRLYPLYAASRYMQNWKDELQSKQDFFGEYLAIKEELYQDTMERKQKNRSQFVIRTREWY